MLTDLLACTSTSWDCRWLTRLVFIDAFAEDEVWAIVQAMPMEKAPGPDGFTGLLYQMAWPLIKCDILQALNCTHYGRWTSAVYTS
jgi:hypothetical protein